MRSIIEISKEWVCRRVLSGQGNPISILVLQEEFYKLFIELYVFAAPKIGEEEPDWSCKWAERWDLVSSGVSKGAFWTARDSILDSICVFLDFSRVEKAEGLWKMSRARPRPTGESSIRRLSACLWLRSWKPPFYSGKVFGRTETFGEFASRI